MGFRLLWLNSNQNRKATRSQRLMRCNGASKVPRTRFSVAGPETRGSPIQRVGARAAPSEKVGYIFADRATLTATRKTIRGDFLLPTGEHWDELERLLRPPAWATSSIARVARWRLLRFAS